MLPNGDLQYFDVERTPHSAMVDSVLCCCKAHCISYMFSWCLLSSWENSSFCRLGFSLNLMPLLGLTLMMGLTTLLDLLSYDGCLAHLLVIFHCDRV